jgi:hypothetical protein
LARRRYEQREAQHAAKNTAAAEELVQCPRCATYVAGPHPKRCARSDCPYPA